MTPSKEARQWFREWCENSVGMTAPQFSEDEFFEKLYAIDFAALQQENERLQYENGEAATAIKGFGNRLADTLQQLADPPPDVQEAVIRKLDLVSRDALTALQTANGNLRSVCNEYEKDIQRLQQENEQLRAHCYSLLSKVPGDVLCGELQVAAEEMRLKLEECKTLQQYKEWAELQLDADREAIDKLQKERDELRTLLRELAEALRLLLKNYHLAWEDREKARAALARAEEILK